LLTIGILSEQFGQTKLGVLSWEPKETGINYLVCICYHLHTRISKGWTVNAQRIALFGFIIIWICYLGVNLLGKGLHSYGFLVSYSRNIVNFDVG
jgi:hypothetical protein